MVTTSRRGVSERKMGAAVRKSRLIAAGGTSLSVLVPLVFSAPVLSSTVTINTANSWLSVNATTTSGGSDAKMLTGATFPNSTATSRANGLYSVNATAGLQEFPFYSEGEYSYGGAVMRTDFKHKVVTSYSEYAGFHQSSAQANGYVEFNVGPLGAVAELSGAFNIPAFREGQDGGDPAGESFESDFFVTLTNLTSGLVVFSAPSAVDANFVTNLILVVGDTYALEYGSHSSIVDGENTFYTTSGFVQLQFLSAGGPLPIPSPVSVYGGLGLMSMLAWRRPGRR